MHAAEWLVSGCESRNYTSYTSNNLSGLPHMQIIVQACMKVGPTYIIISSP